MTPGEELAWEAARLERAHYNMPRRPPWTHDTAQAVEERREAMMREFDTWHGDLKAVS